MHRSLFALSLFGLLAACDVTTTVNPSPAQTAEPAKATVASTQAARTFSEVVRTVEPVAERECRARTRGVNCDFKIVIDDRAGQPANAYQTLDKSGRPIIAFTVPMISDARNADELAFVMGHEAAHHIEDHIDRQQQNAIAGAVLAGSVAVLLGGSSEAVETAQRTGANVGARSYSKDFELEADALGAVITQRAGYDALRGAQFFNRIPDPGNRFLGTHPPNSQRFDVVRKTVAGL